MKARDAFGVVVRSIGLGFLTASLIDLGHFIIVLLGLPTAAPPAQYPQAVTATSTALLFILGVIVLCVAPWIIRLIYGRDDNSN